MRRQWSRLARRLGWDRNPVRRRVDRIQTLSTALVLIALFVVAPAAGWLAGSWVHGAGERARLRQVATHHVATAVVVKVGDVAADGAGHFLNETVWMRWRDARNRAHEGRAVLRYRAEVGALVPAWVDEDGALTQRPRTPQQTAAQATQAGIVAATAIAAFSLGIYSYVRRRLMLRRLRDWEFDWARTAPLWTDPAN